MIKGKFADGTPLLAIPNFVRENREPGLPLPPKPDQKRPPDSIVWMKEV